MELYQLRAFAAVADSGQLTRAADRLHLSQPAVSAQIKALEEELGQRLFDRTSSGMELTLVGRELLETAQRVLAAADALKTQASALSNQVVGKLSIGTLSDPHFIRVGKLLGLAVERYPHLDLELHNVFSKSALESVMDGGLDASFYFGELPDSGVAGLRLTEMGYRVVAAADWAERFDNATWTDIAALPWILAPEKSTHHALSRGLFSEHHVQPVRWVEADNEGVIANLVQSGVGVSLVREDVALAMQQSGKLFVWEPTRLPTTLWFIYLAERAQDPLIAVLLRMLRELWQLGPGQSTTPPPPAAPLLEKEGKNPMPRVQAASTD
jgi:DNA-binding transcriptional LysR family regulator